MARARVQLEPGYILNARPYSDSSLLVETFTAAHGRVGMIARGVRGPKSRNRALLQPLQPVLLSWLEAGELATLTGIEAQTEPVRLQGEQVFYAWYLNELLLRLLQRHDAHPELFRRYALALPQLADERAEAALRIFEKHLLAEIGYGLRLDAGLQAGTCYRYDEERGPVAIPEPGMLGSSLIALRDDTGWDDRARADALKLLRPLIARQLGGKPLESARLLRSLRGQVNPQDSAERP